MTASASPKPQAASTDPDTYLISEEKNPVVKREEVFCKEWHIKLSSSWYLSGINREGKSSNEVIVRIKNKDIEIMLRDLR